VILGALLHFAAATAVLAAVHRYTLTSPYDIARYHHSGAPDVAGYVIAEALAGIELDSLNRTVTRNGTRLSLSVKEFALLQALMRASPAVLSAEDLLEQVWDEHADPFTSTVVVTMSRLRRKLGPPPVIHNTPGIGYRITDPPDQTG
jgi:DNA-binding response OmpR family regulator